MNTIDDFNSRFEAAKRMKELKYLQNYPVYNTDVR